MSEPTVLLDGLGMGESPRWHDGRLWPADCGASEVVAVGPAARREVVVRLASAPFSNDWLPDGRLLVISGRDGRLLCRAPAGREPVSGSPCRRRLRGSVGRSLTATDVSARLRHDERIVVTRGTGSAYASLDRL